ncbi:phage head completion protein [Jannaschia marina]|uniref:phage head completion protein n=1 Tax=Jannaschia marina TaxID=2741674 RepID=UPI0015CA53CF|nr:head-tail adaptor protein [Jannaschia marina]
MGQTFTRRLTLEVPVRLADGGGGQELTWATRGGFWAEVRMRSGALRDETFGRRSRLSVRVRMPAVPEGHAMRPRPGDRLRNGGQVYEVEAVHSDDGRVLTALARVLTGAGGAA